MIKILSNSLTYAEAYKLVKEDGMNLITYTSEEGLATVGKLLEDANMTKGKVLLHEAVVKEQIVSCTCYDIATQSVVNVVITPTAEFVVVHIVMDTKIPTCKCGEAAYTMTVEHQSDSKAIFKAKCSCGQEYGLVYKLQSVVKFKKGV